MSMDMSQSKGNDGSKGGAEIVTHITNYDHYHYKGLFKYYLLLKIKNLLLKIL